MSAGSRRCFSAAAPIRATVLYLGRFAFHRHQRFALQNLLALREMKRPIVDGSISEFSEWNLLMEAFHPVRPESARPGPVGSVMEAVSSSLRAVVCSHDILDITVEYDLTAI